jgi:hypothetical protein
MTDTVACSIENLTPAQRRVLIAKDVIAQLNSKKIVAKSNYYVQIYENRDGLLTDLFTSESQLCDVFKEKSVTCQVCARGAMFVAAVTRFNDLKIGPKADYILGQLDVPQSFVASYEENFFEPQQLGLIESVFETTQHVNEAGRRIESQIQFLRENEGLFFSDSFYNLLRKYGATLCLFADDNKAPEIRMRSIMNNIIRNGGDFVLPRDFLRKEGYSDRVYRSIKQTFQSKDTSTPSATPVVTVQKELIQNVAPATAMPSPLATGVAGFEAESKNPIYRVIQWTGQNVEEVRRWQGTREIWFSNPPQNQPLRVNSSLGSFTVNVNDYIVSGNNNQEWMSVVKQQDFDQLFSRKGT